MKWEDKKVSIIVLVIDECDYLKRCVDSIFRNTDNYELIIVLNGSNNKVVKYVKGLKGITIIYNKENMGYPYGIDQGIKIAKCDLLMFLNSDAVVTPNWLKLLKRCFDYKKDAGITGPFTSFAGSNGQQVRVMFQRRFMVSDEQIDIFSKIVSIKEDYNICSIIGFCFLVKSEVIDKIGVFDWHKWKLGNEEEVEFLWRAKKLAGYESYLSTGCYVHHFGNISWQEMCMSQPGYNIKARLDFRKRQDTDYEYKFIDNDVVVDEVIKT